jgi:RNA polymerase sigma factor (sigma-70 family)
MALPDLRENGSKADRHDPSSATADQAPGASAPRHGARSVDVAALYATHAAELQRACRRLTRDPSAADDLSQETFARLIARLPSLPSTVNIAAYLQVTARNVYLNGLRVHSREFSDDLIEARVAPDDELERDPTRAVLLVEQIDQVRRSTARLNGRQRRALVLREVDGLSYFDIADRLGTSPEAVAQILARARMRLRAEYRREQGPAMPVDAHCHATRDALSAYLDLKLSAAVHDDVQRHLERCDACREVLATYREAGIQLRGAGPLTPLGALLERVGGVLQGLGHATGTTAAVLSGSAIVAVGGGGVMLAHHFAAPAPSHAGTTVSASPSSSTAAGSPFRVAVDGSRTEGGSDMASAAEHDRVVAVTQTDPPRRTTTDSSTETGNPTPPGTTAPTTATGTSPVDTGTLPIDTSAVRTGLAETASTLTRTKPAVVVPAITTPPLTTPSVATPPVNTPIGTAPPVTVPPVTVPPISVPL